MKVLGRIAMIAAAAGIVVGMTAMFAHYRPRSLRRARWEDGFRTRRPAGPDTRDLSGFMGEFLLVGGIGVVGRKVLKVRL